MRIFAQFVTALYIKISVNIYQHFQLFFDFSELYVIKRRQRISTEKAAFKLEEGAEIHLLGFCVYWK